MSDEKREPKKSLHRFAGKALKATIKAIIIYAIYFVLSILLAPISDVVPSFQQTVEIFVIVYISLMIIGELSSGTIFHHFFNAAKALFVILYLMFSLKGGAVGVNFEDVNLVVDLSFFLIMAMFLSALGFAKSVLQAIDFLNERPEPLQL